MNFDILIIGAGLAGLATALKFNEKIKVAIISKKTIDISSSHWAQGGVAGVINNNDRFELHEADTLNAGAGLCEKKVVQHVVKHSADAIDWLIEQGVNFTKNKDKESLHLTKEGGHSKSRIAHVHDFTGKAIQETLIKKIKTKKNITLFEEHSAVDLITSTKIKLKKNINKCLGAYVLNNKTNKVITFAAKKVILASGGVSKAYLYTTNPPVSTGDGICLLYTSPSPRD